MDIGEEAYIGDLDLWSNGLIQIHRIVIHLGRVRVGSGERLNVTIWAAKRCRVASLQILRRNLPLATTRFEDATTDGKG
jgi:hypothetical protein